MINLILAEQVPSFKFVAVNFVGSIKPYTYKTALDLEVGDLVVVDSPSGLVVVTVIDADVEVKEEPRWAIKWVVDVVHTKLYKSLCKAEQLLITIQKQESNNGAKRL